MGILLKTIRYKPIEINIYLLSLTINFEGLSTFNDRRKALCLIFSTTSNAPSSDTMRTHLEQLAMLISWELSRI